MVYYLGKHVSVYITTENINTTGAITVSAGVASTASDSSGCFIRKLGAPVPDSSTRIDDVESIDLTVGKETEDIDLLNRNIQEHIRQRLNAELVVNKKLTSGDWGAVFDQADRGVTGSTPALAKAENPQTTDGGYRCYVALGGTGSVIWYSLKNLIFADHKITPTAAKTTVEALTFRGNLWTYSTSPNTTSTGAGEL